MFSSRRSKKKRGKSARSKRKKKSNRSKKTRDNRAPFMPTKVPGELPAGIAVAIQYFDRKGVDRVGLFRVEGIQDDVQELLDQLKYIGEDDSMDQWLFSQDETTVSSALKGYLRAMTEPLFPQDIRDPLALLCTSDGSGGAPQPSAVRGVSKRMETLYPWEYNVIMHLCLFLHRVSLRCEVNKMTSKNLALVFSPTLFPPPPGVTDPMEALNLANTYAQILDVFIAHAPNIFMNASMEKIKCSDDGAEPMLESAATKYAAISSASRVVSRRVRRGHNVHTELMKLKATAGLMDSDSLISAILGERVTDDRREEHDDEHDDVDGNDGGDEREPSSSPDDTRPPPSTQSASIPNVVVVRDAEREREKDGNNDDDDDDDHGEPKDSLAPIHVESSGRRRTRERVEMATTALNPADAHHPKDSISDCGQGIVVTEGEWHTGTLGKRSQVLVKEISVAGAQDAVKGFTSRLEGDVHKAQRACEYHPNLSHYLSFRKGAEHPIPGAPDSVSTFSTIIARPGGGETLKHYVGKLAVAMRKGKRPLDEETHGKLLSVFHKIALGLREMHQHGIVHGGLSLNNVMMIPHGSKDHDVYITDYGLFTLVQNRRMDSFTSTVSSVPNDHRGDGSWMLVEEDVAALGRLIWETYAQVDTTTSMLESPSDPRSLQLTVELPAMPPSCPVSMQRFIRCCSLKPPERRPSIDVVLRVLASNPKRLMKASPAIPPSTLKKGSGKQPTGVGASASTRENPNRAMEKSLSSRSVAERGVVEVIVPMLMHGSSSSEKRKAFNAIRRMSAAEWTRTPLVNSAACLDALAALACPSSPSLSGDQLDDETIAASKLALSAIFALIKTAEDARAVAKHVASPLMERLGGKLDKCTAPGKTEERLASIDHSHIMHTVISLNILCALSSCDDECKRSVGRGAMPFCVAALRPAKQQFPSSDDETDEQAASRIRQARDYAAIQLAVLQLLLPVLSMEENRSLFRSAQGGQKLYNLIQAYKLHAGRATENSVMVLSLTGLSSVCDLIATLSDRPQMKNVVEKANMIDLMQSLFWKGEEDIQGVLLQRQIASATAKLAENKDWRGRLWDAGATSWCWNQLSPTLSPDSTIVAHVAGALDLFAPCGGGKDGDGLDAGSRWIKMVPRGTNDVLRLCHAAKEERDAFTGQECATEALTRLAGLGARLLSFFQEHERSSSSPLAEASRMGEEEEERISAAVSSLVDCIRASPHRSQGGSGASRDGPKALVRGRGGGGEENRRRAQQASANAEVTGAIARLSCIRGPSRDAPTKDGVADRAKPEGTSSAVRTLCRVLESDRFASRVPLRLKVLKKLGELAQSHDGTSVEHFREQIPLLLRVFRASREDAKDALRLPSLPERDRESHIERKKIDPSTSALRETKLIMTILSHLIRDGMCLEEMHRCEYFHWCWEHLSTPMVKGDPEMLAMTLRMLGISFKPAAPSTTERAIPHIPFIVVLLNRARRPEVLTNTLRLVLVLASSGKAKQALNECGAEAALSSIKGRLPPGGTLQRAANTAMKLLSK